MLSRLENGGGVADTERSVRRTDSVTLLSHIGGEVPVLTFRQDPFNNFLGCYKSYLCVSDSFSLHFYFIYIKVFTN